MSDLRLVIVDPGHFHAALVQKEMYPQLLPDVHVHAPLGPDLVDYIDRIARFNARSERPTHWRLDVHAAPDFLDRMRCESAGGIAILSGRNRGKIERIAAAVEAGLHVIADKPVIIRREDLARFEEVLDAATAKRLVVADLMTGRHDIIARLIHALRADAEIFGEPVPGSWDEPGVSLRNVHQLLKTVAGVPNPRPPWYFDITEQGEALADTGTHLADRAHETLFPGEALDYRRDIRLDAASRWPTSVSLAQFQQLTGEARWPDFLAPCVRGDVLEYFCNGRLDYRIRGIHVRLEARWEWQTDAGDDTHNAVYRGSRARLERRQEAGGGYRPELYVAPEAEIAAALERRIAALQREYPGIGLERHGGEYRVAIPDALRLGHDAHFVEFTRRFIAYVEDPDLFPAPEKANLLAKYYVTTEGVALSHR
jgi:predicted dehydrogenase